MNTSAAVLFRTVLLTALWWTLTGANGVSLIGGATVVSAVAVSLRLSPPSTLPLSLPGLIGFAAFFVARSLQAGSQVALMALRPRLALAPALVPIALRLQGRTERAVLSATLNLLPGTLVAGGDAGHLLVHVLDANGPIEAQVRAAEVRVARMFKASLS